MDFATIKRRLEVTEVKPLYPVIYAKPMSKAIQGNSRISIFRAVLVKHCRYCEVFWSQVTDLQLFLLQKQWKNCKHGSIFFCVALLEDQATAAQLLEAP